MPVTIDGTAADFYRAHDLKRGSVVSIGFARAGMRAYLALAGGVAVEPLLGSRSTYLRIASWRLRWTCPTVWATVPLRGGGSAGRPLMLRERNRFGFQRTRARPARSAG